MRPNLPGKYSKMKYVELHSKRYETGSYLGPNFF